MRYSDDLIEEVRARSDVVDIVSNYVALKRKGSSWFGLCPFHNEKSPSFSVSRDKQMYYCFGCGAGGDVFNFVMEYENFSFTEAVKSLADRAGISLPDPGVESPEARRAADLRSQLLEIHKKAASFYYRLLRTEQGRVGYQYLQSRELSDETIKKFGLGFATKYSDSLYRYMKQQGYSDELLNQSGLFIADERQGMRDKFWNRVIFPIMDVNSRVIGFGGRVMGDGKPKYLNSPETRLFDKSRNLYGLNYARTSRRKNLIACEGYMDVISMHQAGFSNAVASLGTALTAQQCNLMKRYADEVLLLYDSDEAGQKAALRAIPLLKAAGLNSRVIDLSPCKDPDEFIKSLGVQEFEKRLNSGSSSFMFQVKTEARNFDLGDPQGRSDFLHKAANMLVAIEDEIERNTYLNAVADAYHVEAKMLERTVNKLALSGVGRAQQQRQEEVALRKEEKRNSHENGYEKAQKLLLTWLVTYPQIYEEVSAYISTEDFTNSLYRRIAEMLEEQQKSGTLRPASIMSAFSDGEEHNEVAAVFHAQLPLESDSERLHAVTDVIIRIKESSIDQKMKELDPSDMEGFMKMMEERKKLDRLKQNKETLKISF